MRSFLQEHDVSGPATPSESRKRNVRLGLILASIALVFFVGFMVKIALFSQP